MSQVLYTGQSERVYAQFRDEDYQLLTPSGSISVTIQYQSGQTVVSNAPATQDEFGKFYYEVNPNPSIWQYGYYGVWWRSDTPGVTISQDVPNIFRLENRTEGVMKGVMLERLRSMLYMHSDMGGFVNKFPRDRELLDHLQDSLNWWNGHPPALTFDDFTTVPTPYQYLLVQGAVIISLQSLGILESGKHYIYNDNGISLTRDRSGKYQGWYSAMLSQYAVQLKMARTKVALDGVRPRGLMSSTVGFPRSLSRALRGVSKFS
jgi:hypothetical protein